MSSQALPALLQRVGGKAAKKLFVKELGSFQPPDPVYEEYLDQKGRKRQRRRDLPPGLSKRDTKILKKVNKRAHYLDKGFQICGMRFGYTVLLGLIPVAGDVADAALNYFLVVRKAREADIPDWLLRELLFNNAVSAGVGFIPLIGDVALGIWKANSRNALLLEEFLTIRGREALSQNSSTQIASVVQPGSGLQSGEKIEKGKAKKGSFFGGDQRKNMKKVGTAKAAPPTSVTEKTRL